VTGDEAQRARHVALAIDPGEDEDGGFHSGNALCCGPPPRAVAGDLWEMKLYQWDMSQRSPASIAATDFQHCGDGLWGTKPRFVDPTSASDARKAAPEGRLSISVVPITGRTG
jgi:hypothetical protein